MDRGRGRTAILAGCGALAAALAVAGCGSQSHPNEPKPPLAAEVTVNITDHAVQAAPAAVGVKRGAANLTQNENIKEPSANRKAPLVVNFTTSNTTATDTALEIHGPIDKESGPIVAEGNNIFKVALPNGHYTLEAADLPAAKAASLYVGPVRVSSQNDVLLP
jgi:hypothetical protein